MLVITRKVGQKIVIPEAGIEITLVRTEQGTARIGINAPAHNKVLREELLTEQQKVSER